jgi:1,4-alpha-glucan branching enzyme
MSKAKPSKNSEPVQRAEPKPEAAKPARSKTARSARSAAPPPRPSIPAIRLALFSPGADRVCVAGTFNEWAPDRTALTREPDGTWSIEMPLGPGRHEYRFVVDGCWTDDPRAEQYVSNAFGGVNSVLEIRAAE